jgi:hypothetical protein
MQNLLMHGEASATLKQNEIHYTDNPIDMVIIHNRDNQTGLESHFQLQRNKYYMTERSSEPVPLT